MKSFERGFASADRWLSNGFYGQVLRVLALRAILDGLVSI
jgi:hypothetical protein